MFSAGRAGLHKFSGRRVDFVNRPTVSEEIGENPIGLVFPLHSRWAPAYTVMSVAMVDLPRVPPSATMTLILIFLPLRILIKSEHPV